MRWDLESFPLNQDITQISTLCCLPQFLTEVVLGVFLIPCVLWEKRPSFSEDRSPVRQMIMYNDRLSIPALE
jgi:hypothetical protein